MSTTQTRHLTDAELSDLLAGEPADAATQLHLATCDACRSELKEIRDSLASFSGISAEWAQAAAAERVPVPSRWARNLGLLPSWTTGLAMTALTGVLVFNFGPARYRQTHPAPAPAGMTTIANSEPTNKQLAEDNRLMLSIDQELGYGERSQSSGSKSPSGESKLDPSATNAVID